jgi:hypothetical protein
LILTLVLAFVSTPTFAGGKKDKDDGVTIVDGELITADLKDKVRQACYCKTYTYKMIEGHTYRLDMTAKFDSYLRLENSEGNQVAYDDDGGGFPNARITYRAPKTGDYTIVCTTFSAGATGTYKLTVRDLDAAKDKK